MNHSVLILLVGPPKMATTTVQTLMYNNRHSLAKEGQLWCEHFDGPKSGQKNPSNFAYSMRMRSSPLFLTNMKRLHNCMMRKTKDVILASEILSDYYIPYHMFLRYPTRAVLAYRPLTQWVPSYYSEFASQSGIYQMTEQMKQDIKNPARICAISPSVVYVRLLNAGIPTITYYYNDFKFLFCNIIKSPVLCSKHIDI